MSWARFEGGGKHANRPPRISPRSTACDASGRSTSRHPRWSEKPSTLIPVDPEPHQERRTACRQPEVRAGATGGSEEGQTAPGAVEAAPGRRPQSRRDETHDRPVAEFHRLPRVPEVRHDQPLLRLQTGSPARKPSDSSRPVSFERKTICTSSRSMVSSDVVRTRTLDQQLIDGRKEEYKFYEKLRHLRVCSPLRVKSSRGNIHGTSPPDALVGLAVSSGVVEGRARHPAHRGRRSGSRRHLGHRLHRPSWTPLFVSIMGLVTEVGGLMTHGAVIAREYGLPAVVGVENATRRIEDGQRIRVHGTEGYVEIL